MTTDSEHGPVEVFVSYSHEDEHLRRELEKHLALLKRQGLVSVWHDREIQAGDSFLDEIDARLESADLVLLLISSAFMASNYCFEREMARALERHEAGAARVVPVILRPCDWHDAPFGELQALPTDGQPVTLAQDRDVAFLDIVRGIRRALTSSPPSRVGRAPNPLRSASPESSSHADVEERARRRVAAWVNDAIDQYEDGVRGAGEPMHGYLAIGHSFVPSPPSVSITQARVTVERSRSAAAASLTRPLPLSILNVHPSRRTPLFQELLGFQYTFLLDGRVWWHRCQVSTRGDCVSVRQHLEDRWDAHPNRLSKDLVIRQLLEYLVVLRELCKEFPAAEAAVLRLKWSGIGGRVLSDVAVPDDQRDDLPMATQAELDTVVSIDLEELTIDPSRPLARLAAPVLELFGDSSFSIAAAHSATSDLLRNEPASPTAAQVAATIRSGTSTSAAVVRCYVEGLATRLGFIARDELREATDEHFADALEASRFLVDDFEDVAAAMTDGGDASVVRALAEAFEHVLAGYASERTSNQPFVVDFFRFLGHELYAVVVAHMLRAGRSDLLAVLVDTSIRDPSAREVVHYGALSVGIDALRQEASPGRSPARRHARLLRERHTDRLPARVGAEWIREADLLLYLISQLRRSPSSTSNDTWWPFTTAIGPVETPRFLEAARTPDGARSLVDLLGGDPDSIVARWPELTRRLTDISVHPPWDGFDPGQIRHALTDG